VKEHWELTDAFTTVSTATCLMAVALVGRIWMGKGKVPLTRGSPLQLKLDFETESAS